MGIPVVIASNGRGICVRNVTSGAPVMTVATNGFGIPIVLGTKGIPFVVQGGGTPTPTPSATATLTKTSAAGNNPPTYTSDYANMASDETDYIRQRWRVNGGAWQYSTDHLFTNDDYFDSVDGTLQIVWPEYNAAAPFATGALVEVDEGVLRGGVTVWASDAGHSISDTVGATALILVAAANAGRFQSDDLAAEGYPITLTKTLTFPAGTRGFQVQAAESALSATINGVAATKLIEGIAPNAYACSIWTVGSGATTAGSISVAITFAANIGSVLVQAFAGDSIGTVADSKNITETTTIPIAPPTNLTIPTNGVGLAVVYAKGATSVSWAQAAALYSGAFVAGGGNCKSFAATVPVTGKPTATESGGNVAMLCLSWNKV